MRRTAILILLFTFAALLPTTASAQQELDQRVLDQALQYAVGASAQYTTEDGSLATCVVVEPTVPYATAEVDCTLSSGGRIIATDFSNSQIRYLDVWTPEGDHMTDTKFPNGRNLMCLRLSSGARLGSCPAP